jgi:hypothetical protein
MVQRSRSIDYPSDLKRLKAPRHVKLPLELLLQAEPGTGLYEIIHNPRLFRCWVYLQTHGVDQFIVRRRNRLIIDQHLARSATDMTRIDRAIATVDAVATKAGWELEKTSNDARVIVIPNFPETQGFRSATAERELHDSGPHSQNQSQSQRQQRSAPPERATSGRRLDEKEEGLPYSEFQARARQRGWDGKR